CRPRPARDRRRRAGREPRARRPPRARPSARGKGGPRLTPGTARPSRLPPRLPVALERRGAAETTVYATNLSASGVCVHLRRPLPVGDAVLLRFALPGEPGVLLARGRVSWCEEPPPAAGARFVEAGVRFEVLAEPD